MQLIRSLGLHRPIMRVATSGDRRRPFKNTPVKLTRPVGETVPTDLRREARPVTGDALAFTAATIIILVLAWWPLYPPQAWQGKRALVRLCASRYIGSMAKGWTFQSLIDARWRSLPSVTMRRATHSQVLEPGEAPRSVRARCAGNGMGHQAEAEMHQVWWQGGGADLFARH